MAERVLNEREPQPDADAGVVARPRVDILELPNEVHPPAPRYNPGW